MENHIIEKQKMDALKALSDTNLKVSEMRNLLIKLQEEETEYLVGREDRAMQRIDAILKDSESVLSKVSENYAISANLSSEVSEVCKTITDLVELFAEVKQKFAEKCDEWDAQIGFKEDALVELKKNLGVQSLMIQKDKEGIARERKGLDAEKRKLADERGTLERAIKRLKEGRI